MDLPLSCVPGVMRGRHVSGQKIPSHLANEILFFGLSESSPLPHSPLLPISPISPISPHLLILLMSPSLPTFANFSIIAAPLRDWQKYLEEDVAGAFAAELAEGPPGGKQRLVDEIGFCCKEAFTTILWRLGAPNPSI